MNKRSFRFTALIGWLDRPTIDGRTWRGTVRLRATPLALRPTPNGYAGGPFLGRIHSVHVDDSGAVYASGRATRLIAEALNDGSSTLEADLDGATRMESTEAGTIFTHVVIAGAVIGVSAQFPWKERA